MLKKRSAPMSAPKPASVMRKSPVWMPMRSATTDELPWAMLPNGPACTSTGVFSSVWSRFGLMASRMITVMAPAARSSSAVTGSPAAGVADHDPAQPVAHVAQRGRQGEHRHDLGGGGDVEAGLAGDSVFGRAQPDHQVAQRPVVDVEDAAPGDVVQVEAELVAVMQVVVEHGRQHVVGGCHGVHVAGEVEVQRLEGHGLAVAPAGRPALDAEGGAHRRLADGDGGLLADVPHGLTEPERGGRLALAEGRGRDGGHHHVAGPGPLRQRLDGVEPDLGDVLAVGLEQRLGDAGVGGDLAYRFERGLPRDLERARHGHGVPPPVSRDRRRPRCRLRPRNGAPKGIAVCGSIRLVRRGREVMGGVGNFHHALRHERLRGPAGREGHDRHGGGTHHGGMPRRGRRGHAGRVRRGVPRRGADRRGASSWGAPTCTSWHSA